MDPIFESVQPDAVCHLAARTGVRASEMCPREYLENNVIGTAEVLQASAETPSVKHMLFTSSSAVYGNNAALPMTERMRPQDITSVYGASKRSGEVLCETRASLDDLPITIARLFTVYGPWGRPNMAYHIFAHCLANDEPVPIFGDGTMSRDMTFIDDAVEALHRLLQDPPSRGTSASHRVVNVGTGRRIPINQLLAQLEELMGRRAERAYRDAPKVDVSHTLASPDRLEQATGFRPTTTVRDGLPRFVDWYRSYALDQSDA